jgi:ABC-2 type transport system permease protein
MKPGTTESERPVFAGGKWAGPTALPRRLHFSALRTLFWLTIRQQIRGWRLFLIAVLFALPVVVAAVARAANRAVAPLDLETLVVFELFPHALIPLTALLFASGMIQDEVEGQTLTYLLVRPLRRWGIYITKLLAVLLVCVALAWIFVPLTYVAIYSGSEIPVRAVQVPFLVALTLVAYCGIFGVISLITPRSFIGGTIYIFAFEYLLANWDFAIRRLTVVYYFRVLVERWCGLYVSAWKLPLADAPSASACVLILLVAGLAASFIAAKTFGTREFAMKTPGN